MAYNINNVSTAGKVTVFSCLLGLFLFAFIFTVNIGNGVLKHADAQSGIATTSVTVLNTPPLWTVEAEERFESSTTTPTDVGDEVEWVAIGTDSNSEPYYLLICTTNASPTPMSGSAPRCDTSTNQWAVSTSTVSGTQARAATTTLAAWAESNNWYAWICDDNAITPRCNAAVKQGSGTTASPFNVNHRPSFTVFSDNSPTVPGAVVTFMSTSSDTDVTGTADTVKLFVCSTNSFSTSTDTCGGTLLASSSAFVSADASALYTIVIPTQDQDYNAFGFVTDNHGFEAAGGAQGTNSTLTVANAAPTISASNIFINGSTNMTLSQAAGSTTGFTLEYTVTDNNSCENSVAGDEIVGYQVALYRSGVGSTTCLGDTAGSYNPNNCYTSAIATTTWNLSCTASSTSCTGATDPYEVWNCTFPLWYVADPTDGTATSTQYSTQNWTAAVNAVDDDNATSSLSESSNPVEVNSFLSFTLNTLTIPYGSLEPGQQNDPLVATTTISATGNVGLDQRLTGESMCINYATGNECPNSATSTIAEDQQRFSTTTSTYAAATALSSTTLQELEVNVKKSTSTTAQATGNTYWGIAVPISLQLAGNYKGENTIYAITGESSDW